MTNIFTITGDILLQMAKSTDAAKMSKHGILP